MKLHYKGKFDLNPESLPCKPHLPGAVAFKEAKDSKTMALIANGIGGVFIILAIIPLVFLYGLESLSGLFWGSILSLLTLFPHELLHALCFREDVYLYTNLKQGMLFVVGPEDMSKARFVFMSLLPNLLFGFIPYLLGLLFPPLSFLGYFGAISIGAGGGDYYNIFNALTQMPKGARTYMYQFNSYWYMPE